MSFPFELEDGTTLWDPALKVGNLSLAAVEAEGAALGRPVGLRRTEAGLAIVVPEDLRELVEALIDEFTRSNNVIRRRQIASVVPECLVMLERAGLPVDRPDDEAADLFNVAAEIGSAMPW